MAVLLMVVDPLIVDSLQLLVGPLMVVASGPFPSAASQMMVRGLSLKMVSGTSPSVVEDLLMCVGEQPTIVEV